MSADSIAPSGRGGSAVQPSSRAPQPGARSRWWSGSTWSPLLDMPRLPHLALAVKLAGGAHDVPAVLRDAWAFAADKLAGLGGGVAVTWRFERAWWPMEALLHVVGSQRGVCAHVGRMHRSWHIMVTLDLMNGVVWQRCWDQQCRRPDPGRATSRRAAYIKARHCLGPLPEHLVPTAAALDELQLQR